MCSAFFHKSCATRIGVNSKGGYVACCGKDGVDYTDSDSVTDQQSMDNDSETRLDSDEEAISISKLDVNSQALWKLISNQFSNVNMKLDNVNGRIVRINKRIDSLDKRVKDLEEVTTNIEHSVLHEIRERQYKDKNLIIFNCPDSTDAHRTDITTVNKVFTDFSEELPFDLTKIIIKRLAKTFTNGKTRSVLIRFANVDDVQWVFKNKKPLPIHWPVASSNLIC